MKRAIVRPIVTACLIAGLAACLATPAFAQKRQKELTPLQQDDLEKKKQAEIVDKQYNRTVERERANGQAQSIKIDPWANMRAPADSKSAK